MDKRLCVLTCSRWQSRAVVAEVDHGRVDYHSVRYSNALTPTDWASGRAQKHCLGVRDSRTSPGTIDPTDVPAEVLGVLGDRGETSSAGYGES